jgi:hypothetical protein
MPECLFNIYNTYHNDASCYVVVTVKIISLLLVCVTATLNTIYEFFQSIKNDHRLPLWSHKEAGFRPWA